MMKRLIIFLIIGMIGVIYAGGSAGSEFAEELKEQSELWVNSQVRGASGIGRFFTLLLQSAGGGNACEAPYPSINSAISWWMVPTALVLIIVGITIALAIMVGETLNLPNVVALAKDELFHLGTTIWRVAVIIALVFSFEFWVAFSTSNSPDPIYRQYPTYIDSSMAVSREIYTEMSQLTGTLLLFNFYLYQLYMISLPLGPNPRTLYTFDLAPIVKPFVDFIGTVLQTVSIAMVEWLLHLILLCFVKKHLWTFFIPLGILFRSFPPTRNLGESMLSLFAALALIYPLMILITYESHKILRYHLGDPTEIGISFAKYVEKLFTFATAFALITLTRALFPLFITLIGGIMMDLINTSLYYTVFLGMFMPFITVFVTLTAAKEFAKFFQVDINFFSILRII